jgi:hypothetical protein
MQDFLGSNRRILEYMPQFLGRLNLGSLRLDGADLYDISESDDEVLLKIMEYGGLVDLALAMVILLHNMLSLRAVFMFTLLDDLGDLESHLCGLAVLIGA